MAQPYLGQLGLRWGLLKLKTSMHLQNGFAQSVDISFKRFLTTLSLKLYEVKQMVRKDAVEERRRKNEEMLANS